MAGGRWDLPQLVDGAWIPGKWREGKLFATTPRFLHTFVRDGHQCYVVEGDGLVLDIWGEQAFERMRLLRPLTDDELGACLSVAFELHDREHTTVYAGARVHVHDRVLVHAVLGNPPANRSSVVVHAFGDAVVNVHAGTVLVFDDGREVVVDGPGWLAAYGPGASVPPVDPSRPRMKAHGRVFGL